MPGIKGIPAGSADGPLGKTVVRLTQRVRLASARARGDLALLPRLVPVDRKRRLAVSIGSVGSVLSIGSIGSACSAFSVASAGSLGSLFSAGSAFSVFSAGAEDVVFGRPALGGRPARAAMVLAVAAAVLAVLVRGRSREQRSD